MKSGNGKVYLEIDDDRKPDKLSKTAEEMKAGYIWHIVSAEESAIVKLEKMAY